MKNDIIKNIFLNIIATFIPIAALQLLILPYLASGISDIKYGEILTIISLISLIGTALGNSLNNSRLIGYKGIKDSIISSEYNFLLIIYSIFSIFATIIGLILYKLELNIFDFIIIIILVLLFIINSYTKVKFRLKIDYNNILWTNLFMFIGFGIGTLIYYIFDIWYFIYVFGYFISTLFILLKSNYLKEKFKYGNNLKGIINQTNILLLSSVLLSAITYADRLLLFPILGASMVTIYYVSSLTSKLFSMAVTPSRNVLLSYFAQMKSLKTRHFLIINIILIILVLLAYLMIILISPILLKYLYPQYLDKAIEYVPYVSIFTLISLVTSFINAVIIRFKETKNQLFINLIYIIVYLTLSICLSMEYGIYGFITGVITSAVIRYILTFTIYFTSKNKNQGDII